VRDPLTVTTNNFQASERDSRPGKQHGGWPPGRGSRMAHLTVPGRGDAYDPPDLTPEYRPPLTPF
jgi:hypothetical protein